MTIESGLSGSFGFGEETTWGLAVAPTLFLPLIQENINAVPSYIESKSVYAGRRLLLQDQVALGVWKVGGTFDIELTNKSMGYLFKHMFGTVVTTGPVNSLYTHTFTPGDLTGKSLTFQVGRTDSTTGTVHPYTYPGSKFADWEVSCKAGEFAMLKATIASRSEQVLWTLADGVTTSASNTVTSVIGGFSDSDIGKPISGSITGIPASSFIGTVVDANTITLSSSSFTNTSVNATATTASNVLTMGSTLTAASYAASILPMSFISGSVTIGGVAYKTMDFNLKGTNNLNVTREFIGQNKIDEPLEGTNQRDISGTLNSEYFSDVAYHRFLTGVPAALSVVVGRGTSTCTFNMNVQYRGSTPNLSGTDIVKMPLPFKVLGSTTDALGCTAILVNGDATP